MNSDGLVIILFEIYNREFLGRLLLALHLQSKGYNVILCHHNFFRNSPDIRKACPKGSILIDKSADKIINRAWYVPDNIYKDFKIVQLDEEAGGFLEEPYVINGRCHKTALDSSVKFFNWGQREYDLLSNKFPEDVHKFTITGNPRFDMIKPKYRNIFDDERNQWTEKYGNYNLIIGFYNIDKSHMKSLHDYEMLNSAEDFKQFEKSIENVKVLFELYLNLVEELCLRHKNVNFVYKVHPATFKSKSKELNYIESRFKDVNNLFVLHTHDRVEPLILGSNCVIHCKSTTGYQSYFLNKPNINYSPIKNESNGIGSKRHTSCLTGYFCENNQEVFDVLDSDYKNFQCENLNELYARIYNSKEEIDASSILVEEIGKLSDDTLVEDYLPRLLKIFNTGQRVDKGFKFNGFDNGIVTRNINSILKSNPNLRSPNYQIEHSGILLY